MFISLNPWQQVLCISNVQNVGDPSYLLLAHSCCLSSCPISEQIIFPQVASPPTFKHFYKRNVGALVSHEPVNDLVLSKQYLKVDFQAFD